jgi:NifU-like protein involved in Fe-S cluster formation/bacterioferritin-associated ferredoxin
MVKTTIKKKKTKPDVVNKITGESWAYTRAVKDHFFKPRNLLWNMPDGAQYDAEGIVGSPACGDVMRVWLKINKKKDKIIKFKWRTFGCASAIAATSMLSVMVTEKGGMKINKALAIKPQDIMKRLGGLPDRKIHCSVLGDKALRSAINHWFKKTGQFSRIIDEDSRVIDPNTKVTETDIEEAVIGGATTLEAVQKRTKVGVGNPRCIPEVEELIKFYAEKYYGKIKLA